jgi:hypothetical protein
VKNTDNGAAAENIHVVKFTLPTTGDVINRTGLTQETDLTPGWTAVYTGNNVVTFTANAAAENIPKGNCATCFKVFRFPVIIGDLSQPITTAAAPPDAFKWNVDATGDGAVPTTSNVKVVVGVATVGVKEFGPLTPVGARDFGVSHEQEVKFYAKLWNRGTTSANVQLTITSPGNVDAAVSSDTVSVPAPAPDRNDETLGGALNVTTLVFTFGPTNGTRNLTGNLTGGGSNVAKNLSGPFVIVDPPLLNDVVSTIQPVDGNGNQQPQNLSGRIDMWVEPLVCTPLAGTVNVTSGSPTVIGTGTAFLADLVGGSTVQIGTDAAIRAVHNITSNTNLNLTANAIASQVGVRLGRCTVGQTHYLNTTANVTVTLKNAGDALAQNVALRPQLIGQDGVDRTDKFDITPSIGRLSANSANGCRSDPIQVTSCLPKNVEKAVTFMVSPKRCATSTNCDSAPLDGKYNFSVNIDFNDNNTDIGGSPLTTQRLSTAQGFLVVDNTPPLISGADITQVLEFRRGGANNVTAALNATDDTLNNDQMKLVILDRNQVMDMDPASPTHGQCIALTNANAGNFRCQLTNDTMTKSGRNWTLTKNFASFERLSSFQVFVFATDRAGNWVNYTAGVVQVRDTQKPLVSTVNAPTSATLSTPITISGRVADEFRLKDVFARALHVESNSDVFLSTSATHVSGATPNGLLLACQGSCGISRNGTYITSSPVQLPLSGTYVIRIFARDDATPTTNTVLSTLNVTLTVSSDLALYFDDGTTQEFGRNLTAEQASVSQVNRAVFDELFLRNQAGGTDTFNFECSVLTDTTTVANAPACSVTFRRDGDPGPSGAVELPVRPSGDKSWPGTFNVTIYKKNDTTPNDIKRTWVENATGINLTDQQVQEFEAHVAIPPSARPGDTVRLLLTAKPVSGVARASVVLGFVVSEGRGVDLQWRDSSTATAGTTDDPFGQTFLVDRDVKPTRSTAYNMQLRNPGNVDTRYNLTIASFDVTRGGASVGTAGWSVDLASGDSRWNDQARTIRLSPAGTTGGLNSSSLQVVVTAPGSAQNDDLAVIVVHPSSTEANLGTASDITLRLHVKIPSVMLVGDPPVDLTGWSAKNVTGRSYNVTTKAENAGTCDPLQQSGPAYVCEFFPGSYYKFDVVVNASSTRNRAGNPGLLTVNLLVTSPCGASCASGQLNLSMNALGHIARQNGKYNITLTIPTQTAESLGVFHVRLYIADDLDQFYTDNVTVEITEPNAASPVLASVQLFQGANTTALAKDSAGEYRADFGSTIHVKATVSDSGALGNAVLSIERPDPNGGDNIVGPQVPMARTAVTTVSGRVIRASYEGNFTPEGSFEDSGGRYVFRVRAFDAMGNEAPSTSDSPFFISLADFRGPTIIPLLHSGGAFGAHLDVEVGVPVNLTAAITDNTDPFGQAGAGVNRTEDSAPLAVVTLNGVEKFRHALDAVQGDLSAWRLDLPADAIVDTGTYTVTVTASDTSGNLASGVAQLQVLVNLPPVLSVASPAEVAGVRYVGPGQPLVVTVTDANVNASSGIVVTGPDGVIAANVSGSAPTITVTIPLAVSGNVTVTVTATDTLGNSTSLPVTLTADNTPPAATVNVDVASLTAGTAFQRAGQATVVAPGAKLFIQPDDAGSGVLSVVVMVHAEGSNATSNRTLATGTERFSLSDILGIGLPEGRYVVSAVVTDRVGNVFTGTAANQGEGTFAVDSTAPTLGSITPASPLSVQATDSPAGVRSVVVEYGASSDPLAQRTPFSLTASGDTWAGDFPAEATGTVHFLVKATDNVGNTAVQQCSGVLCRIDFENRPPLLRLTATSNGQPVSSGGTVRGTVTLSWTAQDPEGAQVPVTVKVRDSAGEEQVLAENATTVSSVSWDTGTGRDGSYTVTATGSDGELTNVTSMALVVRNLLVSAPSPPRNVEEGGSVLLSFQVTHPSKEVTGVSAVLHIDGSTETVQLFDDGTHGDKTAKDGLWSASYTPKLKGTYNVDLQVSLKDAPPATVAGVASFKAEGLGATNIGGLLPVAALAVVVVALGVFGIRRWK